MVLCKFKIRRISVVGMLFIGALALSLWSKEIDAKKDAAPKPVKPVVLKIATFAPKGTVWADALEDLSADIFKDTGGGVKLKVYPGVNDAEADLVGKLKRGRYDGAALSAIGLSLINRQVLVLQMPGVFKNKAAVDRVRNDKSIGDALTKKFDEKGYKLLGWGEYGWIHMFSKKAVSSIEALKKERVWQWTEDEIMGDILKKLMITGEPRSVPEVYSALSSGALSVVFSPMSLALSLQWLSVVDHYLDEPLALGIGATVLTNAAAKKLTSEQWAIVKKLSAEANQKMIAQARADGDKIKAKLAGMGVKAIAMSAADRAALKKTFEATINSFVEKKYFSKTFLQSVQSVARGTQSTTK